MLSNGDPEMLDVTLRSAGLVELIDPVLSVHATRRYKTDPAAYALGPDALGVPASEILFVSSNCWDAIGATWFGYTTLWINRADAPMERLGIQPTRGRALAARRPRILLSVAAGGSTAHRTARPYDGRRARP